GRPVFGSKVQAPDRQASQQVSFQAALQRAAAPAPAPGGGPQTVEQLIEKLRGDIVDGVEPQANEMRGAMALDQVMTFLDRQPPAERQAAMLRLAEAFPKDAGAENPRSAWVTNGIDYAAALSDLATDPAEAKRREGEETFASGIYDRGNRLMYHPDETDDSQGALAKDIRAFLDQTTRGAGEDASGMKWQVLNRLYERDWVDAGPVMGAIEQVAAEDFGQELLPTSHQGAGTHAAAQAIYGRAAAMGGYSETQAYGIPNQQFYDLAIGARHASGAAQQELAQKLSDEPLRLSSLSQFVTLPFADDRHSMQENGLEMFRRLEWLTRDMDGSLAAQVVNQSLDEMQSSGGLPDPIDFNDWKGDGESWGDSALWNLQAVANRIEGTSAGDAVRARMRDYGMIGD
ncbi:MAG TPA: hypothetical protein VIQ53_17345, partial [Inquilinus sp.]